MEYQSETKICKKCNLELPCTNEFFHKLIRSSTGFGYFCKNCAREKANKFNLENKEIINKKRREKYFNLTREEKQAKNKKETLRRGSRKEFRKRKYQTDSNFKLRMCLSSRLTDALKRKNNKKFSKTVEMLGADIQFVKKYLESQFEEGMSWDNYGYGEDKFHIDHIIPCAAFDLSLEENQKTCFHYLNLRPSWHINNLSKNDFMPNNKKVMDCSQEELDFYINQLKQKIENHGR